MLGYHEPVSYKDQVAGPELCFRSYLDAPKAPNPKASPSVANWYAKLKPEVVKELAADAKANDFGDRVMAHAVAAGVPEGDFLKGAHPDPVAACGVAWNHEDVGNYRFNNAASAAKSVLRRAAFAECAREFDELGPKMAKLARETQEELRALPRDADPYAVWSTYHRAMAAHQQIMPIKNPNNPPVFGYAGAPYVVFTDMITRFAKTPMEFLNYHWLAGISPLPDTAPKNVKPLEKPTENDKLLYCAQKLHEQGPLYSDFSAEKIAEMFHEFDGEAWLEAQPSGGVPYKRALHIDADDMRPGRMMDRPAGGQGDKPDAEKETFRLYQRAVTAATVKDGKGSVELTNIEKKRFTYDCKEVVKVKRENDGSATISRENVCKIDDATMTDKLTLLVDGLPKTISLEKGDELIFFAKRTAKEMQEGGKPSKEGRTSFRTTTATAELVFLAAVRRGEQLVFPAGR